MYELTDEIAGSAMTSATTTETIILTALNIPS